MISTPLVSHPLNIPYRERVKPFHLFPDLHVSLDVSTVHLPERCRPSPFLTFTSSRSHIWSTWLPLWPVQVAIFSCLDDYSYLIPGHFTPAFDPLQCTDGLKNTLGKNKFFGYQKERVVKCQQASCPEADVKPLRSFFYVKPLILIKVRTADPHVSLYSSLCVTKGI